MKKNKLSDFISLFQSLHSDDEAENTKNNEWIDKVLNHSNDAVTSTKKEMVIKAILDRTQEVQVEDLPLVEEELNEFFCQFKNKDYFTNLMSEDYYRLLDLRTDANARVVVVGDIHCDFKSLAAILIKLSVSDYDYYENAYFVFLGDYLDRGGALFEPLLLLMDLKRILGERMIMLKGNHELVDYDENTQEMIGHVIPMNSVPCLNEYCGENKDFLRNFAYFYRTLPTYVYLKTTDTNVLLTHGAIPRQMFLDNFSFNQYTGAIDFDPTFIYKQNKMVEENVTDDSLKSKTTKLLENLLKIRNTILYDMIWGDPCSDKEKYQVSGRFQFGSVQFDSYAEKNNLSMVFRSHEPVDVGFQSFFENRLYTIFSTGESTNEQSGYYDVNPAFAVIKANGEYLIENSFIYQIRFGNILNGATNIYREEFLYIKEAKRFSLNEEFTSSCDDVIHISKLFKKIKEGFIVVEENSEAEIDGTDEDNNIEVEEVNDKNEEGYDKESLTKDGDEEFNHSFMGEEEELNQDDGMMKKEANSGE